MDRKPLPPRRNAADILDDLPENVEWKITEVQTQRKRAERRSIFINGEFAFGISEEMYVKHALFSGRIVTRAFLEEVLGEEERYQARQVAMRFVNRRMRSLQEIEKKLAEREFTPDIIQNTIQFLREYNLVNDEGFARAYVNDQLLRRPIGRRRLQMELQKKGVDREQVGKILGSIVDDAGELANAMAAAEKKLPNLRGDDPRKRERSLATFLTSRGFGWDVIKQVLAAVQERL
jgi:regulatory protein